MSSPVTEPSTSKWLHPNQVLKLQRIKLKKKQLQARIKNSSNLEANNVEHFKNDLTTSVKRHNPFLKVSESKRSKQDNSYSADESSDNTLFKLLHDNKSQVNEQATTSFTNLLLKAQEPQHIDEIIDVGKPWVPIDWSLKCKVRLMSSKPFGWNQKLKTSEEASGITGFVRCLDNSNETALDTSPNANFHQCCLYWQQPSLPWINLFPRTVLKASSLGTSVASASNIRESLHNAWSNSLRSLFQLVRACQCPYFYVCANNFTVLFRASGICGFSEINACVTPTTRGFRQLLKQQDIEYSMPLKSKPKSDDSIDPNRETENEEDDVNEEKWLESMGINAHDIKQINCTQMKIVHRAESKVDNSEQSLVLIEGMEVHAFYNFLMNSKITTSLTGPLAGIPPTLLSPIAFHGATLSALKVKQCKVRVDESDYYSLELVGPILPQVVHNLCSIHSKEQNLTMTFANVDSSLSFSKLKAEQQQNRKENDNASGIKIFGKENLTDCGLNCRVLKHFCSSNSDQVVDMECLKYNNETKTYTWS